MSLLMILSILQQYLLYISTLPHLPFKVSTCHHFGLDPPSPPKRQQCQHIGSDPTPPKQTDVILERSLTAIIPQKKLILVDIFSRYYDQNTFHF